MSKSRHECILDLLESINNGEYEKVWIPRNKGNPTMIITGVISNANRFNFSVLCTIEDTYKTIPIIKDGKITDIEQIRCKDYDKEDEDIYMLQEMPIYKNHQDISVVEIAASLVEESKLDSILSAYKQLKVDYSTAKQSTKKSNENSKESEETKVQETVIVPCVTYQIIGDLPSTINLNSLRENCLTYDDADENYRRYDRERRAARFHTRCLIYKLENSSALREYLWSEVQPLPRSKKKQFQEVSVILYDNSRNVSNEVKLRRIFWDEEIKI